MVSLTINGKDAYTVFGITMDTSSLAQLMTPPPMKERISSKSRVEHGMRVVTDAATFVDSRDLTLNLNISADTEANFLAKYALFCAELKSREIVISTISGTYHCTYLSCQQFSQFMRGVGKFILRLREYNPNNRS
ncbi:MAG: hypothetical protein IKO85_04965 [Bacteroidaceae bacterium]|nr:hypothetical protein [Bacteroidaceae bacterium]